MYTNIDILDAYDIMWNTFGIYVNFDDYSHFTAFVQFFDTLHRTRGISVEYLWITISINNDNIIHIHS